MGLLSRSPRSLTLLAPLKRDWYFVAEQPAPAPHLACSQGRAALTRTCYDCAPCQQNADSASMGAAGIVGEVNQVPIAAPKIRHTQVSSEVGVAGVLG